MQVNLEAFRYHEAHCSGCSEYRNHMGASGRQQDPAGPSGAERGVRLPAASTIPHPTICKCGIAKSYHDDGRFNFDHEYEPRYDPVAFDAGVHAVRYAAQRYACDSNCTCHGQR